MKINYINKENLKKYRNKTCLLRIDLNAKKGNEENFFRIEKIIPTINLLIENNCKVLIAGHRGRFEKETPSNEIFKNIISKKINKEIDFIKEIDPLIIKEKIDKSNSNLILLENLRKNKSEEENSKEYAEKLANLADFYVNDSFPVCHRKNASVAEITRFLPSFGGLQLEKEIKNLDYIKENSESPFTLIIGGAKIKNKLSVISNLWNNIDNLLLGGGPANTFLYEKGIDIKKSIFDKEAVSEIKNYLENNKVIIPFDYKFDNDKIFDIGIKTIEKYKEIIRDSKTIVWNGPMGFFEKEEFSYGTKEIWKSILENKTAKTVIGGGETVTSYKLIKDKAHMSENIFISTGGGAMLYYLANKKLPGIENLKK